MKKEYTHEFGYVNNSDFNQMKKEYTHEFVPFTFGF